MDVKDFAQVFSSLAAIIIFLSLTYFYRSKFKNSIQSKKVDSGALVGIAILIVSLILALLLMQP